MNRLQIFTTILITTFFLSCSDQNSHSENMSLAEKIEQKHGKANWPQNKYLQMKIVVEYAGNKIIDGIFTFNEYLTQVHLKMADDRIAVFDGKKAWISPADKKFPRARFHLITWPWFLVTPLKLTVEGGKLSKFEESKILGDTMLAARQTFLAGEGDSPDDWYIHYINPETFLLHATAYIVTYGKTIEEANKDPHMIEYEDYRDFNGMKFSHKWSLWHWSKEKGKYGEALGHMKVLDLKFVDAKPELFQKPQDAKEDKIPKVK